MAGALSLVVKIGAKDEDVQKALASLSERAKTVDGVLKQLGETPVGQQALKSYQQMEVALKGITDAHQRLADKAVAAARGLELVGGVTRLTNDELAQISRTLDKGIDAFRAMGQDAPQSLKKIADEARNATTSGQGFNTWLGSATQLLAGLGIGLSIGAVVGFGKEIFAAADALERLHDKTGVSLQGLQKFQIAGDDAGNSITEITDAITKMEDRLVGGDASALSALTRLGIHFADIKNLSPEDQFIAIPNAIRKIEEPAQQVSIAIDLFGKAGANVLPTLKRGFDDLKGSAIGMSDETVRALGKMGDAAGALWRSVKANLGEAVADVLTLSLSSTRRLNSEWQSMVATVTAAAPKMAKMVPLELPKDLDALDQLVKEQEQSVKKAAEAHQKAAADAKRHADELAKLTGEVRKLEAGLFVIPDSLSKIGRSFDDAKLGKIADELAKIEQNAHIANFGFAGMVDTLKNVGQAGENTASELRKLDAAFDFTGPLQRSGKLARDFDSDLHLLAGSFAQLAQISGDSFGAMVRDIGTVVAAMDIGAQAGTQMKAAWKPPEGGAHDWGSLAAAAVSAVGAMDQATKSTSRWQATLGGAVTGASIGNSIVPGGGTIGFLAGALVGLIRSAGAAERAINPIREQFVQLHGGIAALNAEAAAAGVTLTAMLNAKNAEQYNKAINDLNAAFDTQKQSTAVLDEAIKRYGFSIEELGPALQRQEMGKQAESIFQDWTVLNSAGIDTIAIAGRMAESVNEYVRRAVAMGIEVPAAMKPMLQQMINQGVLTDAAGNKITDLNDSGITFAQTMTEGFQKVVDAVTRLADSISGRLGTAIAKIPTQINTTVDVNINGHWNIPDMPRVNENFAATGGFVTAHGIQHFAMGGVVQQFAAGGRVLPFVRRGRDTVPAMLTPGELVLNSSQQAALGSALGGSAAVVAELSAMRRELKTELARSIQAAVQKVARR